MALCPKGATFGDPLLDDFRNYLDHALRLLKGVRPSPNQFEIADFIWRGGVTDHVANPDAVPWARMAEALRGVGKSTITHIYVPWEVRRAYEFTGGRPDCHILIVSGTKDLADSAARFIRDLISTDPVMRCLVPANPEERWSANVMNVRGRVPAAAPTIFSRGLFGRMTGDRGDLIVFDDIELPQNAETQPMRDKLRSRAQEFIDVLTPGGEMVGLGTPQVEDTVYNEIEEWGFVRRKWPIRYPDAKWLEKHAHYLSPRLARRLEEDPGLEGQPTEARFPEEVVRKREAVGYSRFLLQNMLDTSLADEDRYPLKLRDLIVTDLEPHRGPESPAWTNDPKRKHTDLPCVGLRGDAFFRPRSDDCGQWSPYEYRVMAVDPSGRGQDETSYAVLAALGGLVYLLELEGLQGGYGDVVMARLMDRAALYRVNAIVPEDNFGDGMFSNLLSSAMQRKVQELRSTSPNEPWAGAAVEPVRHFVQSKESRIIDALEPVMNQHRLVVSTQVVRDDHPGRGDAPETFRLFHQMTRVQRLKGALTHDDRLDALAIGVKHLKDRMRLHEGRAAEARVSREEKAMWDDFWARNQAARGGRRKGRAGAPLGSGLLGRRPPAPQAEHYPISTRHRLPPQ